jgi:uncharacterized protein GlcG (DUF336 family)
MNQFNLVFIAGLFAMSANAFAADAPADTTKPADAAKPAATAQRAQVPAARGPSLELAIEAARVAIETCAADGGQKVGVSVVDSAGVLKVLLAADGTSPRGVTSGNSKAVTALTYKTNTSKLTEQIKTDKALGDTIAANTALNARPGGVLIRVGDEVIGAIGVGGGRTDEPCALAGLQKVQSRLQ